jgi:hypothetical protein
MNVSCLWQTLDDWVTLTAQDPSVFANVIQSGGHTYARRCDDGTIWINETLVLTIVGTLP